MRPSSTQAPNVRGALKCSTSKMLNGKRSSTQAPNIRGILKCSLWKASNNGCSSTQAPNMRRVLQCSTPALTIKEAVQHKRQIEEVFRNAAHGKHQTMDVQGVSQLLKQAAASKTFIDDLIHFSLSRLS